MSVGTGRCEWSGPEPTPRRSASCGVGCGRPPEVRSDLAGRAKVRTSFCKLVRICLLRIRSKTRINGCRGPPAPARGPTCTLSAFGDLRASEAPQWQFLSSLAKPSLPIPAFPSPIGATVPLRRLLRRIRRTTGGDSQVVKECCCLRTADGKPGARGAEFTRSPADGVRSGGTLPAARRRADVPAGAARPHETRATADPCRRNWGVAAGRRLRGRARDRHLAAALVPVVVPMGPQAIALAGGRSRCRRAGQSFRDARPEALSIRACQGQRPEPSSMRVATRQGIRRNLPFRLPAQATGRPQPSNDLRVASRPDGPAQAR